MNCKIPILAGAAFACVSLTAVAQPEPSSDRSQTMAEVKRTLNGSDQEFLVAAFKAGLIEIDMGNLAKARGTSAELRVFAQRLVDDHQRANVVLSGIATKYGVALPKTAGPMQMANLISQTSQTGSGFDVAFAAQMVADHQKAIAVFRLHARTGQAKDLREFAESSLPTLEEHLRIALDLSHEKVAATR